MTDAEVQDWSDYFDTYGTSTYDTNAAVNPSAAAATSPLVTSLNGTTTASPGWFSSFTTGLGSLLGAVTPAVATLVPAYTALTSAQAGAAATQAQANAAQTTSSLVKLAIVGGVILACIVGFVMIFRRK
jgi:cobalamin biosynthesis Mg chelatase CobN